MRDLYIKNGQGFVVCYSLTNHQTFQDIKTMKDQIVRVKGSDKVPILLVANKVDLENQREVPTVEGMVRHIKYIQLRREHLYTVLRVKLAALL